MRSEVAWQCPPNRLRPGPAVGDNSHRHLPSLGYLQLFLKKFSDLLHERWGNLPCIVHNSKLSFHGRILRISCPFAVRGFRFQNLGYVPMGPSRFPPFCIAFTPENKHNQLGIFHIPKEHCITLYGHALSTSCRNQFSAVSSNTLIKLTCTTEWRYAATRGSGKAYVTAGRKYKLPPPLVP